MILGTRSRYAVMAMAELTIRNSEKPVSLVELAKTQEITVPYLEQIFRQLKAGGLVRSARGPGGGYILDRDASEIRISQIIDAVDEKIKITRCSPEKKAGCMSDKSRCVTHDLWYGLGRHIHEYLSNISLADICNKHIK